jgi:hypothetical protein
MLIDPNNINVVRVNDLDPTNRLGVVEYTDVMLDDSFDAVQLLFSRLVPLKIDHDAARKKFIITARCKQFDEIAVGSEIPTYKGIFECHADGSTSLTFKRDVKEELPTLLTEGSTRGGVKQLRKGPRPIAPPPPKGMLVK